MDYLGSRVYILVHFFYFQINMKYYKNWNLLLYVNWKLKYIYKWETGTS